MKQNRKKRAFTLVEIVVVIAIIGILSAVLIPTFSGAVESANRAEVEARADAYRKAYLSLTATKGVRLKYVRTDYETESDPVTGEELIVQTRPIYHAPFGPEELSDSVGVETPADLKLVTRKEVKAPDGEDGYPQSEKAVIVLIGFLYLDIDRGYYGYFNAEDNKFEVLPVSELPPPETSYSTINEQNISQIMKHHFKNRARLPKYWYPGA